MSKLSIEEKLAKLRAATCYAGAAYQVWKQDDLESLFKAHNTYQTQMLSDANQNAVPPAILLTASDMVGL